MHENTKRYNKNLTIPNAISVLRILLIPFFVYYFLKDRLAVSVVILLFSGLTDAVDGIIARKFNQITELGKMLDPLADKLTQVALAVCLAFKFHVLIPVLVIFFIKEVGMLCGACLLLKRKKRPCAANWYGKVSTVMFYLSVTGIVLMDYFKVETVIFDVVSYVSLGLTAVMMIYSAIKYFMIFRVILSSEDEAHQFDLPEEIRAKK
jgi:Phosphatidylglycerophosphate synthase